MQRSRSSKAWMQEHVRDPYVQRAQREGYRSRAAYKLEEIDRTDRLLKPGAKLIDLGAAPGGWSQVAAKRVGAGGRVVAVDLLPIPPIPGVTFVQGDFSDATVQAQLIDFIGPGGADLVLCDMSPNISGIASSDQARAYLLAEAALDFAAVALDRAGAMLIKVFQGADFAKFRAEMGTLFASVAVRKPGASRDRSPEVYLLGREKRRDS